IGTTAPIVNLHINGAAGVFHGMSVTDAGTGATLTDGLQFGIGTDNNNYIAGRENVDLNIWTNNTNRMTIQAGGNVGIGVPAPATQLELANNTAIKLGSAYLSSGTPSDYVHLANNEWFN